MRVRLDRIIIKLFRAEGMVIVIVDEMLLIIINGN